MLERVYILTELGKRVGQNISPRGRDEVIDYLYSNKTARLSEFASHFGTNERASREKLRKYIGRGLVQELTS